MNTRTGLLRTRSEITVATSAPLHPGWRRCSSVAYRRVRALLAPCHPGASTPILATFISARVLTALVLIGCGAPRDSHPAAVRTPAQGGGAGADDPVLARVDGVAIHASQVARQARLDKVPAREALEELVRMELLAAHARRLGYGDDPDVIEEARRASVRRYLSATFERDFTPADIPEADLVKHYQKNLRLYVHPELRKVVHALVPVQEATGAEQQRRARERALAIAAAAAQRPIADAAAFRALAEGFSDADLLVRVEELVTSRQGQTVEEFASAAFALGGPGRSSGVVATSFGYHVIYLVSVDPAVNLSFVLAKERVREAAWPEVRAAAFLSFMEDLSRKHQVIVNYAPLRMPSDG